MGSWHVCEIGPRRQNAQWRASLCFFIHGASWTPCRHGVTTSTACDRGDRVTSSKRRQYALLRLILKHTWIPVVTDGVKFTEIFFFIDDKKLSQVDWGNTIVLHDSKPLLESHWHIIHEVTWGPFNWTSLWPNDAIWRQRSGTFAQIMACCMTAPSHYLNQWVKGSFTGGVQH